MGLSLNCLVYFTRPSWSKYAMWLATNAFASGVVANSGQDACAAVRNADRSSSDHCHKVTPSARNCAAASAFFVSNVNAVRNASASIPTWASASTCRVARTRPTCPGTRTGACGHAVRGQHSARHALRQHLRPRGRSAAHAGLCAWRCACAAATTTPSCRGRSCRGRNGAPPSTADRGS